MSRTWAGRGLGAALVAVAVSTVLLPGTASAAGRSVSATPVDGRVAVGDTVTVVLRQDSGRAPVNAVQAELSYPAERLQLLTIDVTRTSYDVAAPSSGGGGRVSLVRGSRTPLTGAARLAVLTFKALRTGTAEVAVLGGTRVLSSTTHEDVVPGHEGAVVRLVASADGATTAPRDPVEDAVTPTPTDEDRRRDAGAAGAADDERDGGSSAARRSTSAPGGARDLWTTPTASSRQLLVALDLLIMALVGGTVLSVRSGGHALRARTG